MAEKSIRQWISTVNASMRSIRLTREECIAMNHQIGSEATLMEYSEYGGCSIKVLVTPCVCVGVESDIVSGINQGGSFYSTNAANEVGDWIEDAASREHAMGWQTPKTTVSGTGDRAFDEAVRNEIKAFSQSGNEVHLPGGFEFLANMDNVRRYLDNCDNLALRYIQHPSPDDLTRWFHEEFQRVSGFNIGQLMQKLPSELSAEESQALLDYQAFRRGLAEKTLVEIRQYVAVQEDTRAFEMSVLAEDCYGDSEHLFLSKTNYEKVDIKYFPVDDPRLKWIALIEKCNSKCEGFHAQPYINMVTGELTIAFEGSNLTNPIDNLSDFLAEWPDLKADWKGNIQHTLGGIPEQYVMAKIIAESVPEGVTVNFTGHSLGGALASVAGLVSGAPAYTYNAEGVNNNVINNFGLQDIADAGASNVKAYRSNSDPLTSAQEGVLKPVGMVILTNMSPPISTYVTMEAAKGNVLSPSVGDKKDLSNARGHKVVPMINELHGQCGHYDAWQSSIYNAGYGHEQQSQSSIQIRIE